MIGGNVAEGKLDEFGFELDEKALEGKREVLAYKVTHGKKDKPFRLTFTKKNSILSNSDAMLAILTKNTELLKEFEIVEKSLAQDKKSLIDEIAEL